MIKTARVLGEKVPISSEAWAAAFEILGAADDLQEFVWHGAVCSGVANGFELYSCYQRWIYFADGTFLLQDKEELYVCKDSDGSVRNLLTGPHAT